MFYLFEFIHRCFLKHHSPQSTSVCNDYCLRPETYSYEAYARLASHFSHNEAAAADWLTRLKETPPDAGHVTYQMTSLVASILVVSNALRSSLLSLEVLTVIAVHSPTQVRVDIVWLGHIMHRGYVL